MRISLKQGLWERDHNLLLNLPDTWNVEVLRMEGDSKRVLGAGAYRKAILPLHPFSRIKERFAYFLMIFHGQQGHTDCPIPLGAF